MITLAQALHPSHLRTHYSNSECEERLYLFNQPPGRFYAFFCSFTGDARPSSTSSFQRKQSWCQLSFRPALKAWRGNSDI